MVTILLAVLVVLQILGLGAAVVLVPAWVKHKERVLTAQFRAFVESQGDQPSPLAVLTDQVATLLAARLWQQVEARLRGGAGTAQREENREAEAQVAASGPLAALAMAFLPKKAKMMMMKNPQFLGSLGSLLGGSGKGSGSGANHGAGQSAFKMEM